MENARRPPDGPDNERAYYDVGWVRSWMRLDPAVVAAVSTVPAQDGPEWRAFAHWVGRVADAIEARVGASVPPVED
jgi:hypothetical protein